MTAKGAKQGPSPKRGARYEALQRGDKFYTSPHPCKRGHMGLKVAATGTCIPCKNLLEAVRIAADRENYNARKVRERAGKLRVLADKAKASRDSEPPEKRSVRLQQAKEKSRAWRRANPRHHLALTTAHKARIKRATPAWADSAKIVAVYNNCPLGWQVDHVIPLRGKLVSGLHVHDNLQYLPAKENRAKSNQFEVVNGHRYR